MKIVLTNEELDYIYKLTELRQSTNSKNQVASQKKSDKGEFEISYEGFVGEYGFCKHFNLKFDDSFESRQGGYDCIMKNYRIDVKTSVNESNSCVYVKIDRFKQGQERRPQYPDIDVFAFCVWDKQKTVTIVGWHYKDFICSKENVKLNRKGDPMYVIPKNKLNKFK